jgi:maltose O-acetyltransferase
VTDQAARSQKERMLAGEHYIAADPELTAERERALRLMARFNATDPANSAALRAVLSELLGGLGEGTEIRPPLYCDYGYQTSIGSGCFVNFGVVLLDVARVTIGDHVQIGPNVQFLTPTHPVEPEARKSGLEAAEPITVGDNVWLGGGVILLPGVSIGADTVVGAGSVVTRSLPERVVAVGNPARVVRNL